MPYAILFSPCRANLLRLFYFSNGNAIHTKNKKYMNPLLLTDGYKVDHRRQYPIGTSLVYSNWTPRKSRIEGIDEVVFFGLQYFIKKYIMVLE